MNRITTVKKMNLTTTADPGSFRDPSGFIFRDENLVLKRCIHPVYQSVFRENMENGFEKSQKNATVQKERKERIL